MTAHPLKAIKGLLRRRGIELVEAAGLLAAFNFARAAYGAIHGVLATDFATYYANARGGLLYGWARLYDVTLQQLAWRSVGVRVAFTPNPNTPFLEWVVAPFVFLPFALGYVLWVACLIGALVFAWQLTAPGSGLYRVAYLAMGFSLIPVTYGLGMGQADALVAGAIAGSWWLLSRRHDVTAGLLLTAVILKPQLAFLVPPVLVAAYRWRAFSAWLLGVAASSLVAVLILGVHGLGLYLNRLATAAYTPGDWSVVFGHTIFGLFGHGIVGWTVVVLITSATLLVGWRWRKAGMAVPIAAALVASLLVTPYVHNYDITMLLPAAWLYVRTNPPSWHIGLLLAGYLAANTTLGSAVPVVETLWLVAIISRGPVAKEVVQERAHTAPRMAVASLTLPAS